MAEDYDDMEEVSEAPERDRNSKPWLDLLKHADDCFHSWQEMSDDIDKQYADMEKMANTGRDREFQIFWADASFIEEHGNITLREVIAQEASRAAKKIREMKYRTFEEFKAKNPEGICPICGEKDLDID